ncbi:hypothetical protein [Actinocorallia aurantiaca]|uniref:Uncharacterized protein n=1 Tax=Actinocorallia aurantiaca TaxID=46204 RepID=A0ABN3U2V9_9ACTN
MDFPTLLRDVQRRPGAYGLDGSYREFVAFINGCNAIADRSPLDGFREWLAERLGLGANLVWWELVRRIHGSEHEASPADEDVARTMFALLYEFAAHREGRGHRPRPDAS